MAYGIQPSGFINKPLQDILDEIAQSERDLVDAQLNTSDTSVIGNINAIFAARLAELWDKLQDVYGSQYPNSATGASLDLVASITGTTRLAASKSTISVRLNLNDGVTVPAGSVVAEDLGGGTPSTINRFVTTAAVTNSSGSAADFDVTMEGETEGPLTASAGAMVIVTPVSGWNTATALSDAIPGRLAETDAELRVRRLQELRAIGNGHIDSILADVEAVSGVSEAFVLENETSITDANGLPPHSFEVVVLGGDDQEIADAIWANKPAGIETFGTTSQTVADASGATRTVKFTRPTLTQMYLEVDVTTTPGVFPLDGAAQIAAYIEQQAADDSVGFNVGDDVIISKIQAWACTAVPGVKDVTAVRVGTAPSPTQTTNWTIGPRELAQIADTPSDRLVVNVT